MNKIIEHVDPMVDEGVDRVKAWAQWAKREGGDVFHSKPAGPTASRNENDPNYEVRSPQLASLVSPLRLYHSAMKGFLSLCL